MTKHIKSTKEIPIYTERFTYDDYPDLLSQKQKAITKKIVETQGILRLKQSQKEKTNQEGHQANQRTQIDNHKSVIGELSSDIAQKNEIVQSMTKVLQDQNKQKEDLKVLQDQNKQKEDLLNKVKPNQDKENSPGTVDKSIDSLKHHRRTRRPSKERLDVASTKELNSEGQILHQKMEEILQRKITFGKKFDEDYQSLQNKLQSSVKQYPYKVEGLLDLQEGVLDFKKRSEIQNMSKDLYSKSLVSANLLFASQAVKESKYHTKLDSRRDAFVGNILGEGLIKYGTNAKFLGSMYLLRRSFYERNDNNPTYIDIIQSSSLKTIFEDFVPK